MTNIYSNSTQQQPEQQKSEQKQSEQQQNRKKERKKEHGIGLSSVKSTLKKYKSEISFSEDKYWFTVLIVIDKYEYIH